MTEVERATENLIALVRRLLATPDGQHLLLLDRLNDVDCALGDYDRATQVIVQNRPDVIVSHSPDWSV